METGL